MTRIEFAPEVTGDLDRTIEHLQQHDSPNARARVAQIASAIDALVDNPLIGRPVARRKRELIIGRDAGGHVALYSHVAALDLVLVLAIRSQSEAGYANSPPMPENKA